MSRFCISSLMKSVCAIALPTIGLLALSGCSSSTEARSDLSSSMTPTSSPSAVSTRNAGWAVKDVRICVTRGTNPEAPEFVVDKGVWSKGNQAVFDADSPANQRNCYETDANNVGEQQGWVSTVFDFDDASLSMAALNPIWEYPKVMLCRGEASFLGGLCNENPIGLNRFSQGETFTMDGKGHFFKVTRLNDQGSFIAFDVVVIK